MTDHTIEDDPVPTAFLERWMLYRCLNDSDWTMVWISPGCRAVTGYHPDDLIGNRRIAYSELITTEDRLEVSVAVQDALAEKRPFQLRYRIVRSDGRVVPVWEQGIGVRGPSNRVEHLEGVITTCEPEGPPDG